MTRRLAGRVLLVAAVAAMLSLAAVSPALAGWSGHATGPTNAGYNGDANGLNSTTFAEYAAPGGDVASEPAVTDHGVFTAAGESVVAYSGGTERWSRDLGAQVSGTPAVSDALAFVVADDTLYALDAQTGETAWSATLDGAVYGSPAVDDGVVYVGTEAGTLYAYTSVGTEHFTYDAGAAFDGTTPAVADGTVYAGTADGTLHAVDPDGTANWTVSAAGARLTSPVVGSDRVYVAAADGTVAAYGHDGASAWTVDAGDDVLYAPVLTDQRLVVPVRSGTIQALAPGDGSTDWSVTVAAAGTLGPRVSAAADAILVGTDEGSALALAPGDGSQQWSESVQGSIVTTAAVGDQSAYVGTDAGVLYRIGQTYPVVEDAPAKNRDDDIALEDVNGDGEGDIFDALDYYDNRNSDAIQDNSEYFDFDGDGTAGTIFDAIALYNELTA